jgi:hypothetical protein
MDEDDEAGHKDHPATIKSTCPRWTSIWLMSLTVLTLGIFIILLIFSILSLKSVWTINAEIQKVADYRLVERIDVLLGKFERQVNDGQLLDRARTVLETVEKKILPSMEALARLMPAPAAPATPSPST